VSGFAPRLCCFRHYDFLLKAEREVPETGADRELNDRKRRVGFGLSFALKKSMHQPSNTPPQEVKANFLSWQDEQMKLRDQLQELLHLAYEIEQSEHTNRNS
jgi:hypothetical protein